MSQPHTLPQNKEKEEREENLSHATSKKKKNPLTHKREEEQEKSPHIPQGRRKEKKHLSPAIGKKEKRNPPQGGISISSPFLKLEFTFFLV